MLNILAFVLLLITLQPPLDDGTFPLQQRLFPDFHGCTFYGRDVFSLISGQAWLFWRSTGETPGSFFEVSLGSFTRSFQFNRMWTAPHFPTPPKNNLNQPSSTYDYLVTEISPCGHALSFVRHWPVICCPHCLQSSSRTLALLPKSNTLAHSPWMEKSYGKLGRIS